ncbi:hypothetical protein LCGC14_2303380 [marine sediment metagenome]|uniref:Uncharacterized protein n=1 Tax=marine sediment metagenome TaxID=412755 RepID=A0A0F9CN92_9ZZZZ
MRITINVTKRDITTSGEVDCPITRALRRVLGVRKNSRLGDGLLVGDTVIYFMPEDSWDDVDLASMPQLAQAFVDDFDNDRPLAPFSFVANFNQASAKRVGLTLPTA